MTTVPTDDTTLVALVLEWRDAKFAITRGLNDVEGVMKPSLEPGMFKRARAAEHALLVYAQAMQPSRKEA